MRAMRLPKLLLALSAWLILLVPAANAEEHEVELRASGFVPPTLAVDAGDTVHFTNRTGAAWSVKTDDGLIDSGSLPARGAFDVVPTVPGSFTYKSGASTAKLTVRGRTLGGPVGEPALEQIPDLPFPPVEPGDVVVDAKYGVAASKSRILLGFKPGATVEQANEALTLADVRIIGGLPELGILLVEPRGGAFGGVFAPLEKALVDLRGAAGVAYAARSTVVHADAVPRRPEDALASAWSWEVPLGHGNWGLAHAKFPQAWNLLETIERSHPTAVTGIVDAGFEPHDDLPGLEIQPQLCPRGGGDCRPLGNVPSAHGNHVAGIIGAAYDNSASDKRSKGVSGANPVAKMHGYSIASFAQWSSTADVGGASLVDQQLELYDLILRSRPPELRVINQSLGAARFDAAKWAAKWGTKQCNPGARDDDLPALGGVAKQPCTPNNLDDWQREMANIGRAAAAIARSASQQGVMIVQSAGNEGNTFCGDSGCHPIDAPSRGEFAWASRHWEDAGVGQNLPNPIFVVQAIKSDGTARADTTFGGDIAAPGNFIHSTVLNHGYGTMGGSSMAAPYVTGLISYLLADNPSLSIADVRKLVLGWADGGPGTGGLDFTWSMPDKMNRDANGDSMVDYLTDRTELDPIRYDVDLDACGASVNGKPIATYAWTADGETHTTNSCRFQWHPWEEGTYSVSLTATATDGTTATTSEQVEVKDFLVVSVGDSIASGEGNPDIASVFWARWQLDRCHRSAFGGPAQAARWLEAADSKSSVSFLHLACSGGRIEGDREANGITTKAGNPGIGGLLTGYEGVTEDSDDGPCAVSRRTDWTLEGGGTCEPPQIARAGHLVGERTPDALLISIGANDMWFSSILTDCLKPWKDCSTSAEGKGLFEERIELLDDRYAKLAQKIQATWPDLHPSRVIITQYPDLTTDETGQVNMECGVADGIDPAEQDWAHNTVIPMLNFEVEKAAGIHGWTVAAGIPESFIGHGYCSNDPWIVSIVGSFLEHGDKNGAFHPNYAGHSAYATKIADALKDRLDLDTFSPPVPLTDRAPRLNAYRTIAGAGAASRVVDVNDPSKDGNRRVSRSITDDGIELTLPDNRRGYADGEKTAPDGKVDMRDLRRFRDAWLQGCLAGGATCPAAGEIELDGGADHVKRDLNFDACVSGDAAACGATEGAFSRLDFNGDDEVHPERKLLVPWAEDGTAAASTAEGTEMSDLDVLRSAWTGGDGAEGWTKDQLDQLMRSADVEVQADAVLETGASKAELQLRHKDGGDVGPKRTIRRRDDSIVMTVPVSNITQQFELISVSTTDKGTNRSKSAPFTLSYGEDRAIAVCPDISLKASPGQVTADGTSTSTVTALLHRCQDRQDVADRPVTFTMTPASGGATLTPLSQTTNADGRAQATFTAGTVQGDYAIKVSIPGEEGQEPLTAETVVEVAPKLTVKYLWSQTIEQWTEQGTTRWTNLGTLLPDCVGAGMEYCIESFQVGLENQQGIRRAGTLNGGGSRFKLTEQVTNSQASSLSSWGLTWLSDGETEQGGKRAIWAVTDPNAYTDKELNGLNAADETDAVRLSGMQTVGDLPYHYSLAAQMTEGNFDPIEGHSASSAFFLIPQGGDRKIRFAAQPGEDILFRKNEDGTLKPFQSCGVLTEDLTTEPGYYSAESSEYIPGATTIKRDTQYDVGDRPLPTGAGNLKIRYSFAAVAAYEGQTLATPVLPDCTVPNAPTAAFEFSYTGDSAREGRQVSLRDRSTDPDNDIVKRTWEWGDGHTSTGMSPWHLYDDNGTYQVKLTVEDAQGNTNSVTKELVVANEPPEADIDDVTGQAGSIEVRYRTLDPGKVDKANLEWKITSSNPAFPPASGTEHAAVWTRGPYTGLPAGTYPLTLTVRDKDGGVARDDAVLVITEEPPPPPPPPSTATYSTCDPDVTLDTEEREFVDLVNEYREENGLPPVTVSATLTRAAEAHAHDMAEGDFMSHTGSDGSDPGDRAVTAGYPASAGVGENLAETETAHDSMWAWRGSLTGHNENMLNPAWNAIGIARENGDQWRWATSYGTLQDCEAISPGRAPAPAGFVATATKGGVSEESVKTPAVEGEKAAAEPEPLMDASLAPIAQMSEPPAPSYPPSVAVALAEGEPRNGLPVEVFNRSRDASGNPVAAKIEFDHDDQVADLAAGASTMHTYPASQWPASYRLKATATDGQSRTSTLERWVYTDAPQPPTLTVRASDQTVGATGKPYTVAVNVLDDQSNDPVAGVEVTFAITGGGTATGTSDEFGVAQASPTMPATEAVHEITATTTATDRYTAGSVKTYVEAKNNTAPVADAGGPYAIGEGAGLLLNGVKSSDPDPSWFDHLKTFKWDLDDDGQFDDASGRLPATLTGDQVQQVICGGTCAADQNYPIKLEVTDSHGDSHVDATTMRIVPDFDLLLGGESRTVVPGQSNSFAVTVIGSTSYTKPVTLSVEGLPNGVTASFSKNPVTPTDVSVLTLTAANGLDSGTFPVNVKGTDGTLTRTVSDQLSIAFGLPPICYGQITGIVKDSETGQPLAGAEVYLTGGGGSIVTTDASGRYLLEGVSLGWNNAPIGQTVTARNGEAYWDKTGQNEVACGALTEINLSLLKVKTGLFRGVVVDKETQEPISGAGLYEYACAPYPCGFKKRDEADLNGNVEWTPKLGSENTPTWYTGRVMKAGYWEKEQSGQVSENAPVDVRYELVKQCMGTLKGGNVVFQYADGTTVPAPNAKVLVYLTSQYTPDLTVTADANGDFAVDKQVLLAYENSPRSITAQPVAPEGTPAGAVAYPGQFKLNYCGHEAVTTLVIKVPKPNFGTIEGTLTDQETNAPIAGAYVKQCVVYCEHAQTDENGFYRFEKVFVGNDNVTSNWRSVSAEPEGYHATAGDGTLKAGETLTLNMKALKKKTGALSVKVTDAVTGAAIPYAGVFEGSYCSSFCQYTKWDGTAGWKDLPLGYQNGAVTKWLTAEMPGYWPQQLQATIKAGETTQVEFKLQPECKPAKIVGTVVNANTGAPIEGASLFGAGNATTNAEGRFEIADVKPSTGNNPRQVWLTASASGFYSVTKQITIFCGATITVDFGSQTSKTGTIVGTVTDGDTGQPLAGAFVGTDFGAVATTDEQGKYRIEQVPLNANNADREWNVMAKPAGFKASTKSVVVKADTEVTRDFAFTSANAKPAAQGTTVELDEDTWKELEVSGSDTDGDALTYHVTRWPKHGKLLYRLPTPTYEPDDNYNGTDSFAFIVNDGVASSDEEEVTIDVHPVNDAPGAYPDHFDSAPDTEFRIPKSSLLGNDYDADAEALMITEVRPNRDDISVKVEGDEIVFMPPAGWKSDIQYAFFDYTISDGAGKTSTAWVYIRVNDGPVAPNCPDRTFTVKTGTTLSKAVECTDKDGDPVTYTLVSPPVDGTLDFKADGTFTYTPEAEFIGSRTFYFKGSDGTLQSQQSKVTVHVVPDNRAPVCSAAEASTEEDTPVDLTLNCADPDGDAVTLATTAAPGHGSVEKLSASVFKYTPAGDYNGDDEFSFRAADGALQSPVTKAVVHVTPAPDAPVCAPVTLTVDAGASADVTPSCTDADGDAMTFEIAGAAGKGTASVADGKLRFEAPAEASGADEFTYLAKDGGLSSQGAKVSVTINGAVKPEPTVEPTPTPTPPAGGGKAPVAGDDEVTAPAGAVLIPAATLLANDRDEDGDKLAITAVSGAVNGTAALEGEAVRFTPAAASGIGRFDYTVTDGRGTDSATVFVYSGEVKGEQVLLGCENRAIVLEDVIPAGRKVQLLGVTRADRAGQKVEIRFEATGKVVARPKVGPDGRFKATAPMPPKKLRGTSKARYVAKLGADKSLALKLMRQLQVARTSASGGKAVISGRVTGVLAKKPADRVIEVQRVTCARAEVVGTITPKADGSFKVAVDKPADAAGAVFRLRSKVRANKRNDKLFETFSLPRVVNF